MPVSYHHLHYHDFKSILSRAGFTSRLSRLKELEDREKELRQAADVLRLDRRSIANASIEEDYERLRPFMRPCHQKRFDLKHNRLDAIFMESKGWLF